MGEFEAMPNKNNLLEEANMWRLKSKYPDYASEYIEKIDDETFLKRHSRYERDEKKRKRWDIQRMREKQEYERLKAIEARKDKNNKRKREIESSTQSSVEINIEDFASFSPLYLENINLFEN